MLVRKVTLFSMISLSDFFFFFVLSSSFFLFHVQGLCVGWTLNSNAMHGGWVLRFRSAGLGNRVCLLQHSGGAVSVATSLGSTAVYHGTHPGIEISLYFLVLFVRCQAKRRRNNLFFCILVCPSILAYSW